MAEQPVSKTSIDIKLKQYEVTVVEFIRKYMGHFIVASHDASFQRILRNTINKQLAIDEDCITTVTDENRILRSIKEVGGKGKPVILFVERLFNNKETGFLVKQIKEAFNNVKIIILTVEAERQRLVLLHEIGADNFISKPISINTLIEKIAFTIKPQGKIGKLIDSGKQSVDQGNHEQALKISRQILDLKPNSAAAYLIQGDAFKALGKKDKAIEAYEEASNQAKLYLEPLKKLADFFRSEGDNENTLRYLEKLDKLSPLNVERKVDMGGIHVALGNDEKAEALFEGALAQAKKEAMNYIEEISTKIGDIYTAKNPEKAVKYYRKALETKGGLLDKNDIKTFNLLGIALRKQGKWQDAIAEYVKALQISPEDENLFYNMAMAYAEGQDFRRASEMVRRVLDINPKFHANDHVLSYNLGLIFARTNNREAARRFLEYSLKIEPNFPSAKKLLDAMFE
jgi:tetratricopeptide (TPR) repeat protein